MIRSFKMALGAALLSVIVASPAAAFTNPITRACTASDRDAASRTLCTCIGRVARATLTPVQMRIGARWFEDPQRAQDVRMSDRASDEAMWDAWNDFADAARAQCG